MYDDFLLFPTFHDDVLPVLDEYQLVCVKALDGEDAMYLGAFLCGFRLCLLAFAVLGGIEGKLFVRRAAQIASILDGNFACVLGWLQLGLLLLLRLLLARLLLGGGDRCRLFAVVLGRCLVRCLGSVVGLWLRLVVLGSGLRRGRKWYFDMEVEGVDGCGKIDWLHV